MKIVQDKQKQTMYIGVTHRGIYIYHVSRMVHYIKWFVYRAFQFDICLLNFESGLHSASKFLWTKTLRCEIWVSRDELEKVDYVGKEIIITPVSSYVSPYSSSSENEVNISRTF